LRSTLYVTLFSHYRLTILTILTILTVHVNSYTITKLNTETAIYENLGSLKQISSEWRILTHVNITDLYRETKTIKSCVLDYEALCKNKLWENQFCKINLEILKSKLVEIQKMNEYLQLSLTDKQRSKRSLFNAVGELSKTLFGTLTEDDAKFFNVQMEKFQKMSKTYRRI
jgi:Baculovirus F protein